MKKDIVIYGASGLGREILYLIKSRLSDDFNVIAFIDDGLSKINNMMVSDLPVYPKEFLLNYESHLGVVIAIADPKARKNIYKEISSYANIFFPSVISPDSSIAPDAIIGQGAIIKGRCFISVNVKIGLFVLMNTEDQLGHDVVIEDFVTLMPRSTISGNVKINESCLIGAQTFVLQGKSIGNNSILAPGSIVFTNVPANVTVMGNPATILMKHKKYSA